MLISPIPPPIPGAPLEKPKRGLVFYAMIGAAVVIGGLGVALAIVAATQLPRFVSGDQAAEGFAALVVGIPVLAMWMVAMYFAYIWLVLPITIAKKMDVMIQLLTEIRNLKGSSPRDR